MFLPMFMCCCNTRRNQSAAFLIYDFCLGYSKTKTMKHWGNTVERFHPNIFIILFMLTNFLRTADSFLEFKNLISENSTKCN